MDGLYSTCFAGDNVFGDHRLARRLGVTFEMAARRPDGTLPKKLSDRTSLIGAYRLFNNKKVTHRAMLKAHQQSCLEQFAGHPVGQRTKVLLIHDTTVLDYSGLDIAELGQVGDGHGRGLYAHNSLMVIPSSRRVVGLFNQILHRRADVGKNRSKKDRIASLDRESRLWKDAVADLPDMPDGIEVIDVSDRGSDLTEYIAHEIKANRKFIVRSQHNRILLDDENQRQLDKLHDRLRSLEASMRYTIQRVVTENGPRDATVRQSLTSIGLAFERVRLNAPRQPRGEHDRQPLEVWGVIAREIDPPEGVDGLEWILLTNVEIDSPEKAKEVIDDYACRWMIEDYHKAMKTGCGIEDLQMTTKHGLSNAIALLSVLAVHVLRLRCHARDETMRDQPAREHEDELKVKLAARHVKAGDWRAMTVFEYYLAVARLGGYQLNPKKHPPGWLVLWRGYIRLEDMAEGVRVWQGCV